MERLAGRRILVVEDEMMVLMNIETALGDVGCATTSAGTVQSALKILEGGTFDAAMLDVNLHGESSYSIADALALRGIPFLFSTGYGDHGGQTHHAGRPVLRKPYLRNHLLAALTTLMGPATSMTRARRSVRRRVARRKPLPS